MPRIYLAGPEVFLRDAARLAQAKRELCDRYGFVGVSPIDSAIDASKLSGENAAQRISAANEALIRGCAAVIANITPFRGPSADVGTAYEMGYARALGKLVLAYTNVAGSLLDRTRESLADGVTEVEGGFEDTFQMAIEDFDQADNLMLTGAVQTSARVIVSPAGVDDRFTSLAGFEACLELAAKLIGRNR